MTITRIDFTLDTLSTDVHNDADSETDGTGHVSVFIDALSSYNDAIDSY